MGTPSSADRASLSGLRSKTATISVTTIPAPRSASTVALAVPPVSRTSSTIATLSPGLSVETCIIDSEYPVRFPNEISPGSPYGRLRIARYGMPVLSVIPAAIGRAMASGARITSQSSSATSRIPDTASSSSSLSTRGRPSESGLTKYS